MSQNKKFAALRIILDKNRAMFFDHTPPIEKNQIIKASSYLNQGSLEVLDRTAIQMSIFDIPKWAHLYALANYYENYQESHFIICITINFLLYLSKNSCNISF